MSGTARRARRPRRLRPGDTVAVVSPSWGGPAVLPLGVVAELDCGTGDLALAEPWLV